MAVSFSGLSGFDFGSLADALIQLERIPIDTLTTKKEDVQSRKSMWTEISSALQKVRDAAASMGKPTGLSFAKATSAKSDQLGVSASSNAAVGTYQVTVHQLATASRVTSGFATQLGLSRTATLTAPLNSSAAGLGTGYSGGYVTINGTQVAVNIDSNDPENPATNDTVQDLLDRINSQVSGVTASYDAATDKLKLESADAITVGSPDDTSNFLKKAGLTNSPDVLNGPTHERTGTRRLGRIDTNAVLADATLATALTGTGSFTINGQTIDYDASADSLNDLLSRINSQVPTVSASYDAQTDRLVLSSKETGSLGITRNDVSGNFLEAAGLLDSAGDSAASVTLGQNAAYSIPGFNSGAIMYSTTNTVSDAVDGLTLTFKEADPATPIEVTVARDSSQLKTKVSDFVAAYNEAVNLLSTRLTEEPLANASSQATRRVGLLRGDSMLSTIRSTLASNIVNIIDTLPGNFNRLGNLGISIDKNNVKIGTLSFDEEKFNTAVDTNFEQAYDILFSDADGDGKMDDGEIGAVPRMMAALDGLIDSTNKDFGGVTAPVGTIPLRNTTYDSQIKSIDLRIDELEQRLILREATLRAKFLAAESAISSLSAMGTSLGSQTIGIG